MRTLVLQGDFSLVAVMLDGLFADALAANLLASVSVRERHEGAWRARTPSGASVLALLNPSPNDGSLPASSLLLNCAVENLAPREDANAVFAAIRALHFTPDEMAETRRELPITSTFWSSRTDRPLAGIAVVFTIHHMRDFLIVVEQLLALGADPALMTVIDKQYPYAHSARVDAHLKRVFGVEVWLYSDLVEGLRGHVKRAEVADARSLIMDDGGYIYPVVCHELQATAGHWLGIVEQTMSGIWKLDGELDLPVFSVAESELKSAVESYGVADASIRNVLRLLPEEKFEGQPALVLGYGRIGRQLASILRDRRLRVAVYDTEVTRLLVAHEDGFVTRRRLPDVIRSHQPRFVFGSAGRESVSDDELRLLRRDSYLASTTSRDYEFPVADIALAALETTDLGLLGHRFRMPDGNDITLTANGMPVNFHYAESLPNRYIDIVMASLVVGALAIVSGDGRLSLGHNVAATNALLSESGIVDAYYNLYGPSDA